MKNKKIYRESQELNKIVKYIERFKLCKLKVMIPISI